MTDYPLALSSFKQTGFHKTSAVAESSLSKGISNNTTIIEVLDSNSNSTWPTENFVIRVNFELIYITERSANLLTVGTRGVFGTRVQTHQQDDYVAVVATSELYTYNYNELIATQTELDSHKSAVDPHPQYIESSDVNAAIIDHENSVTQHQQYQLRDDRSQSDGYTPLDSSGKVHQQFIPDINLSDVYEVSDIASRDTLSGQEGDVVVVQDNGTGQTVTYIYNDGGWVQLVLNAVVVSVNGLNGDVSLNTDHITGTTYLNTDNLLITLNTNYVGDGILLSYDDNTNVLTITNTDKGSEAVAIHEGEVDPHPQYLTEVEADALYASVDTTGAPSTATQSQQMDSGKLYVLDQDITYTLELPSTMTEGQVVGVISEGPYDWSINNATGATLYIGGVTYNTNNSVSGVGIGAFVLKCIGNTPNLELTVDADTIGVEII